MFSQSFESIINMLYTSLGNFLEAAKIIGKSESGKLKKVKFGLIGHIGHIGDQVWSYGSYWSFWLFGHFGTMHGI